jgi:hypothetical protein
MTRLYSFGMIISAVLIGMFLGEMFKIIIGVQ